MHSCRNEPRSQYSISKYRSPPHSSPGLFQKCCSRTTFGWTRDCSVAASCIASCSVDCVWNPYGTTLSAYGAPVCLSVTNFTLPKPPINRTISGKQPRGPIPHPPHATPRAYRVPARAAPGTGSYGWLPGPRPWPASSFGCPFLSGGSPSNDFLYLSNEKPP